MRITFLLHTHSAYPGGGPRVIFEYANQLIDRGHEVSVVLPYSLSIRENIGSIKDIVKYQLRKYGALGGYKPSKWFKLNGKVKLYYVPSLNERYIPKSDALIVTYWPTAEIANKYSYNPKWIFYLIQGEDHVIDNIDPERVKRTWKYPYTKIVISKWIQNQLKSNGEESIYIPNGNDKENFNIDMPIEKRNPFNIIMLYHPLPFKGSNIGLDILNKVRTVHPLLQLTLFGVPARPRNLPDWVTYHQKPSSLQLRNLYNNAAIYISASLSEGWGLTGCEAASCGAALCLSDIGGHREYAIHGVNSLLCPPGDITSMVNSTCRLITDDQLRVQLAKKAYEQLDGFSWVKSARLLEKAIMNILSI